MNSVGTLVTLVAALFIVVSIGCGGDDAAPTPGDGPDAGGRCTPHLVATWKPRWKPPRTQRGACTERQIDLEYESCDGPRATSSACRSFREDAANEACLACLLSDEDDPSYGPIIEGGGLWKTNTSGCIALLDGDVSADGCGAKVQAASECYDAACAGCMPAESFLACRQRAPETVCRPYYLDSICLWRPAYASCTEYSTNEEYFRSAARRFCGDGATTASVPRHSDGVLAVGRERAAGGWVERGALSGDVE